MFLCENVEVTFVWRLLPNYFRIQNKNDYDENI